MTEASRIRFNPGTGEIEIEGSEDFVKTYFMKLQTLLAESAPETVRGRETAGAGRRRKAQPNVHPAETGRQKKSVKAAKNAPGEGRTTNIERIIKLIHASKRGIGTAELREKTGLSDNQIWNIVNRTVKEGRIRKIRRGLYTAA